MTLYMLYFTLSSHAVLLLFIIVLYLQVFLLEELV